MKLNYDAIRERLKGVQQGPKLRELLKDLLDEREQLVAIAVAAEDQVRLNPQHSIFQLRDALKDYASTPRDKKEP